MSDLSVSDRQVSEISIGLGLTISESDLHALADDLFDSKLTLAEGMAAAGLDGEEGVLVTLLAAECDCVRCDDCGEWGEMDAYYEMGDDTWLCECCWVKAEDEDTDDDDLDGWNDAQDEDEDDDEL